MGLKLIGQMYSLPLPEFFSDQAYTKSSHFKVSSSQVPLKSDSTMCYGPVVADGYGCCYNPRDNDINFAVSSYGTSKETSTTSFVKCLTQSLIDMKVVLEKSQKAKL